MTRELIGALAISLVAVVAVLAYLANRSARKAQEHVLIEPETPTSEPSGIECFYVATVFADAPLNRVWAYGLGGRGKCQVLIDGGGIKIFRQGERDLSIPQRQLVGLTSASATIDKAVEKDGLLVIRWSLGETELGTHLRIVSKAQRTFFISEISNLGVSVE